MKQITVALPLALCLLPGALIASSAKRVAAPTVYVCSKCHMNFSAALAKKDHYKDPMDGGTLVPVKHPSSSSSVTRSTPVQATKESLGL